MEKNIKLLSSVEVIKGLREQSRSDMMIGFYGRYSRCVGIRKAGYIMGFKEEKPFRKK